MKMVKSLLLVSAAGLVAASGAQAADLPVKAKPVEYVKVCSLYGAGFYYIPGTDICMKIGGYVRFQQNFGTTDVTGGPFTGVGALNNSVASQDQSYRTRWLLTHDTRQQTAYGTLRTYMIIGMSQDSGTDGTTATPPVTQAGGGAVRLYSTRAFIQIAGFTFGKATSFFDFFSTAAVAYQAGSMSAPDTGDGGHVVAAYTAQLGNGISATISAEQERTRGTRFAGAGTAFAADLAGAQATGINALQDIVANVRIDQAWGSAQLAVAAHNASGSYYGTSQTFENNGRPGNKWGWAVTGGLRLNAPMIGPGDYFQIAAVYAKGATRYASNSPGSLQSRQGQGYAFQFADDAVFTGTALVPGVFQLTTAFSVSASYEHFWTPALRTSIYGSFFDISRSDLGNNALCAGVSGAGTSIIGAITGVGVATSRAAGCELDSSYWVVGSRSQWNVTKDLYVGLDVMYSKLNTARLNAAGTVNLSSANGINGTTGPFLSRDQNALSVAWRIHRDIVP